MGAAPAAGLSRWIELEPLSDLDQRRFFLTDAGWAWVAATDHQFHTDFSPELMAV